MPDATQRGGALAAVYRQVKTKEAGVIRIDRTKAVEEANKMAKAKGDGRNKPMAKSQGPSKPKAKV